MLVLWKILGTYLMHETKDICQEAQLLQNVAQVQNILTRTVKFIKFNISNHCPSIQIYFATNKIKNKLERQLHCHWLKPVSVKNINKPNSCEELKCITNMENVQLKHN